MSWQQVELSGYAYYSKKGYRILVSLVKNDGYDFVAEKDGNFIRVNVKTAGLKDKSDPTSWSVSKASGSSTNAVSKCHTSVDVYLVWLSHQDRFLELPGDFLSCGNSKSRRVPRELLGLEP